MQRRRTSSLSSSDGHNQDHNNISSKGTPCWKRGWRRLTTCPNAPNRGFYGGVRGHITSDAAAGARRQKPKKLTKVNDAAGPSFYQSLLNPDGTESHFGIDPPSEAELGPDYIWEPVSAFPGRKGAPRAWDTYSANVLTSSMEMEQSQHDGCLFHRF